MVHTTMLRAFPENLRKTTETIIPRGPPARTAFDDVGVGAAGPPSVLGTLGSAGSLQGLGSGSPVWGGTRSGSCPQGWSGGVPAVCPSGVTQSWACVAVPGPEQRGGAGCAQQGAAPSGAHAGGAAGGVSRTRHRRPAAGRCGHSPARGGSPGPAAQGECWLLPVQKPTAQGPGPPLFLSLQCTWCWGCTELHSSHVSHTLRDGAEGRTAHCQVQGQMCRHMLCPAPRCPSLPGHGD